MQYRTEYQQRLEALGIRLYVTNPKAGKQSAGQQADDFWQSQLGMNIRLAAKNIDISQLPAAQAGEKHFAKRIIWQKIRLLLKSR